ncbi:Uncharacterised protein [Mycobacteroides abscessus subsp. abscessus]|nr:Uncharacterised protein [Mycobacteroides abscessus subsp. abscessus]
MVLLQKVQALQELLPPLLDCDELMQSTDRLL